MRCKRPVRIESERVPQGNLPQCLQKIHELHQGGPSDFALRRIFCQCRDKGEAFFLLLRHGFKTSSTTCFAFVTSSGLTYKYTWLLGLIFATTLENFDSGPTSALPMSLNTGISMGPVLYQLFSACSS